MISPEQWVLEDKEGLVPLQKWQKTVDVMARIFGAPAGFIVQHGPDGYQVVIASQQESNPYGPGGLIPEDTNIFCKKVVEERQPLYVQDAPQDPFWDTNPEVTNDGFRSYLGLPVLWPSGEPFGTICVMDFEVTDYQDDYVDLISELRDLIEADLSLLDQYQLLASMALTDELTELLNRRGFFTVAKQTLALSRRSGLSLGLVYLDMDGLKKINDQYGHAAGDQVLQKLAVCLRETVRENDLVARLAGDEFALLVAAEDKAELDTLRLRLKGALSEIGISASMGGLLVDQPDLPLEHWLELADRSMYQEKQR